MHPRTLQRRLAAEGTTFEAIVDSARRSAALRLLTQTDVPMSQVALMVELAGPPSLTRACRRWFGRTPTQVRRDAMEARAATAVAQG
jgi:AraC-like DNA-binding protein